MKMGLTSSDVQTLHRQHPVIVPCIVEPVLHHCIVGKLLEDFNGFVLSPCLVKCYERKTEVVIDCYDVPLRRRWISGARKTSFFIDSFLG